jgi:glycine cleavage system H protein
MSIKYTPDHEWLDVHGDGTATVGITVHAQDALGDVVFVDLPEVGKTYAEKEVAGVVESVKAAADVYMPVDGEVVEVNEALRDDPALANTDPLKAGWFFKVKLSNPSQLDALMDSTAYDALFRQLDLTMGERLLILAVGSGVGTAALQLASAAGATVIGTSRTAAKLKQAMEMGMEVGVDTSKEDLAEAVNQATYGSGVHAVLDLVGGKLLEASLRVVALRGRVVVVGTTGGSKVEVDLGLLLRRRIHLFGTVLRSRPLEEKIALAREFSNAVLPLISSGRIRPVIDSVFPMDAIRAAHERMEENASFGKIVLTW